MCKGIWFRIKINEYINVAHRLCDAYLRLNAVTTRNEESPLLRTGHRTLACAALIGDAARHTCCCYFRNECWSDQCRGHHQ